MDELDLIKIPLFSSFPPGEIDFVREVLKPFTLEPGMILFNEGEPGDKFYIITAGRVEIIKSSGAEDEQILDIRGPGDFFGEMSLLIPDGLRTASVRADSDVQLLELSRVDFEQLLHKRPALALEMVRELSMRLRQSDNVMIHKLTHKNQELAKAYQDLKDAQAQIVEKEKLEHELDLAHQIQQSILPDNLALMDGFDIGARMEPARAVGGDFYDFIKLDRDTLGISIGDVSDKGVPAAIFMALYCSLLRVEAPYATSPGRALRRVNQHLLDMRETGMFVTGLYGVLNQKTQEFSYARAGHLIPMMIDDCGKEMAINHDQGQLLGVFPDPDLDIQTVAIPKGNTLFLYTDGLFDVIDKENKLLGEEQLKDLIRSNQVDSAQRLCDKIIDEIKLLQRENPQFDDMTLVAVQNHSSPRSE